jgi:AhpC/TSA family protein
LAQRGTRYLAGKTAATNAEVLAEALPLISLDDPTSLVTLAEHVSRLLYVLRVRCGASQVNGVEEECATMRFFQRLCLGLGLAAFAMSMSATAADLKERDDAPDWELKGTDGKTYKLSEFKGQKAVVVAWYPKAKTGG